MYDWIAIMFDNFSFNVSYNSAHTPRKVIQIYALHLIKDRKLQERGARMIIFKTLWAQCGSKRTAFIRVDTLMRIIFLSDSQTARKGPVLMTMTYLAALSHCMIIGTRQQGFIMILWFAACSPVSVTTFRAQSSTSEIPAVSLSTILAVLSNSNS